MLIVDSLTDCQTFKQKKKMKRLYYSWVFLKLAIVFPLLIACSEKNKTVSAYENPIHADGKIYGKTDGDNHGSTGKMNYNGYTYKAVKIGNQWWMAENLRTITYNDGTAIPNVKGNSKWSKLKIGALCDYNNEPTNGDKYGKLYNWYAIGTGKLAPPGWHVPSDGEWKTLEMFLGIQQGDADAWLWRGSAENAGGKLKETGTKHWSSPNEGATNESGFKALAGGGRSYDGTFYSISSYGYFWSSSEYNEESAYDRELFYSGTGVLRYDSHKVSGYSVRCVQD